MNRPSYLLFKKCSKCEEILHVSRYYKSKKCKYGVNSYCKQCQNNQNKEYKEKHEQEIKDYQDKYKEEHREEKLRRDRKYYKNNKEIISKKNKVRYENNKEKYSEIGKTYYKEHREERLEYRKQYYQEHKEEIRKYNEKYRKENPQVQFNGHHKRKQLEENQGNGVSREQWFECFEFFNWECAYSGIQLTKDNRNLDHIVALDNGGEHEIWNCVPILNIYNSSKWKNNMLEWYLEQDYFDIDRLTKIYEWRIYAYWKWKE